MENKYPVDLNINQFEGRVRSAPVLSKTTTGKSLLSFSLAYQTPHRTDNDGSHTSFIQVEAWESLAEMLAPLLTQDLAVIVNGHVVQKRFTDSAGKERDSYIVSANHITVSDLSWVPPVPV